MTTTPERPAESAGELYYPTPVTPEETFQAIGRLRKEARDEIDRLIRFLDETDSHMEREPDGDEGEDNADPEPSLGSFDGMMDQSKAWALPQGEFVTEIDAEEDDCDNEPSLGSISCADQTQWADGPGTDLEDEHDGAEPENEDGDGDPDGEPSLGWTIDGIAGDRSGADRELQDHATVSRPRRKAKGVAVVERFCGRKAISNLSTPPADRPEGQNGP